MSELPAPNDLQPVLKRRGRGYDRDSVDHYVAQLGGSYRKVWGEREVLRARLATVEQELEQFRGHERIMREMLATAQRTADETAAEAETKAAKLVADAEKRSGEMLVNAQRDAAASIDVKRREREQLQSEIGRLASVRREAEMALHDFIHAVLDVIEQGGESDLGTVLAARLHAEGQAAASEPLARATVQHEQASTTAEQ